MLNRVVLVGRLTRDPEMRITPSGVAITRFTLAVNRSFKDASGEQKADFINIVAFRKQAENVANYVKKGSLVGVDGRIQTGSYEGQDGKRVYTTDVVAESIQFLEPRNAQEGSNNQSNGNYRPPQQNVPQAQNNGQNYTRIDEDPFANNAPGGYQPKEDDLPF